MKLVNHLDHLSPPLLSRRYHRPHPIADPQRPDHDHRGQHGPHAAHAGELKGACHRLSDIAIRLSAEARLHSAVCWITSRSSSAGRESFFFFFRFNGSLHPAKLHCCHLPGFTAASSPKSSMNPVFLKNETSFASSRLN